MRRRHVLAAGAAAVMAPRLSLAQANRVLNFIPYADVAVVDPVFSTAYTTRTHALACFDTLWGMDENLTPQYQMLAGHTVEDDGLTWKLTLRDSLQFHDGTPVLARDCVASIKRWGARDAFGQVLMDATNELTAPDDKTIQFRLKRKFPLLPMALGRASSLVPGIMPERLANHDPFRQQTEVVGSGPFKFVADERVPGARVVYARHTGYVPRADGTPSYTAGPRTPNVDRVVFNVITDPGTAIAALQTGDADWVEQPLIDLLPTLQRNRNIAVEIKDRTGMVGTFRFNHLNAPFNNAAVRRVVLNAVNQATCMTAVASARPDYWQAEVGFFPPGSPIADKPSFGNTDAARLPGMRQALIDAGYKGEKVVLLVGSDVPRINAICEVMRDVLTQLGMNVDYVSTDWGSVVARINSRNPVEQGGWSCYCTYWSGMDQALPAMHTFLRANGARGATGWPDSPELEALRTEWLMADTAQQGEIGARIAAKAAEVVPYIPLGLFKQPIAYRRNITGILNGAPVFTNLRKG
ncbi:ABC transporter substrate-binding protein [Rhodovarius lipocyclicus]|uniref:ABC transporter substrate-binding protein n=1 Tax=Rhodovarius lipocyclicus TaxID=268410 RepID=UPI001357E7D2|nr:ABC transporter substrate-binding protein [Rhodovarius lipocyclicus]